MATLSMTEMRASMGIFRALWFLFGLLTCCVIVHGNAKGIVDELWRLRRASHVNCAAPDIQVFRGVSRDAHGTMSLHSGSILVNSHPTKPSDHAMVDEYRRFIEANKAGAAPLPLEALWQIAHDPHYPYIESQPFLFYHHDDVKAVRVGYASKPSSILAAAYVELALLQKALRMDDKYRATLDAAFEQLKLDEADYSTDLAFRKRMPPPANFVRPEVLIVFLKAEDARKAGKDQEAIALYQHVAAIDPAGPCAWESLVRLNMIEGVPQATTEKLRDQLLANFPSVWGAMQDSLEHSNSKNELREQLPLWIQKAARVLRDAESAAKAKEAERAREG